MDGVTNTNENNMKKGIIFVISCLAMATGICSCSSDDNTPITPTPEQTTPRDDERALRQLTINNAPAASRRVVIDADTYAATWEAGDLATYFNLSDAWEGTLTASSAGASTSLSGSVYCSAGDYLAVIYPAVGTIEQPSGKDAYFTIALSGQQGTLEDIGDRYHYVYGVGEVTSVDGNTASGTITNTKGLLSLCKFTFKKDTNPVNVKELEIRYGSTGAVNYPQTGQVTMSVMDAIEDVHVEADAPSGTPLTITLPDANPNPTGVFYVALFPGGYYDSEYGDGRLVFHFTVSDGTNTYIGTKKVVLKEGKYYEVDIAVN